jgi:hypothetical protein
MKSDIYASMAEGVQVLPAWVPLSQAKAKLLLIHSRMERIVFQLFNREGSLADFV